MSPPFAWDIVVAGGANFDYLVRGPKLPQPGETAPGDVFDEAPGGKGANQAVAAARLGARVAFVGRIGADERGEAILARLREEGVDTRHAVRDAYSSTGVALVMVNQQGQKQILTAPGANRQLTIADVLAAAPTIAAARVLLTQLEVPLECVMAAARLAHAAGAKVVLDPAPPIALPDEFLPLVDVVKPNAAEAEALTGVRVQDRDAARRAARRLLERGVGAVAVQAGEAGNLLVWPEAECWLPRIEVESVDATGAGDAFAAALAVALAEGRAWSEAGALASASAALATTVIGAQAGLPRRQAAEALLARVGYRTDL
jgi:ribokinase